MGFFSRAKDVGGVIFNFRVTKWMGLDQIKRNTTGVYRIGHAVVTPEQADYDETFEQAMQRLGLTEEILQQRRKEFTTLLFIYILAAIAIFAYSLYIVINYKNFMGFIMGLAVTVFALVHAFRYHFWLYQIKHRKLGSSIKDWFLDKP